MKCIPERSTSSLGFRCSKCGSKMEPDDSRECEFTVETKSIEITSCCPGSGPVQVQAVAITPCQPIKISDCKTPGYERCCKCGHVFVPGESRERSCANPHSHKTNQVSLSFLASAGKFVQAYMKWVASGKQVLNFTGILQRFRICSACDEYNDNLGKCNRCNCFVNLLHSGQGMNKLEWSSEQCPLERQKWNKQTEGR